MRPSRYGWLAILNVAGMLTPAVRGDEQAVAWKDLPAAVRQSAEKAVAGAKWSEAARADEEGEAAFRLKGTDAKGGRVEATLTPEGQVTAVETVSPLSDPQTLPVEVRKAAESAVPGAKWVEAAVRTEESATTYRLKGADAKGLAVEATLRSEVHVELVETALDLKDLPGPLADALKPMPGAKWSKAVLKAGEDETTYEAVGTDVKGRELSVTVTDGGRSEVRTELEVFDVPSAVIDALKAKRPMFRPDSVALVDDQGSVAYVFDGKEGDGVEVTLSVSPDGKAVAVVDDGADEDDE